MTLALYGKSRRRQGVLVLLALMAVMVALLGGVAVQHTDRVNAASITSGQLNPIADGGDSAWSDSPDGASDYLVVDDGTCAAGDTDYIFETSNGTDSSSFDLNEAAIPNGSLITSVNVTFCYSDHDTTDADEQIRPYARLVGNKTLGTTVAFAGGSQTPTLAATQQIAVSLFKESDAALDLEIGVDSLNGDDVRVYAIWATVTYKTAREIKVQKVASTASHAGGSFSASVTDTTANPDVVTNVPLTLAAGVQTSAMSGPISAPFGDVVTAAESPPPGWTLFGFRWIQNNAGDQTCPTAATGYTTGNNQIPADNNDYLLCVRNAPSAPDLVVEKTSSVPSIMLPTNTFTWTINLKNTGSVNAVFGNNALVFSDQLPNVAGVSYSSSESASNFGCAIDGTSKLLTCSAEATGLTMAAPSTITVTVTATVTNTGTLTNGASACSIDPSSLVSEGNEGNNTCPTSAVTINPAAACTVNNVAACIALLVPVPPTQTPPLGVCQGVNANFVIDISGSIGGNMGVVKSGIQSFASTMGASSKYAGTSFSDTATNITAGYVPQATFNTAVGTLASAGRTWTEGGIAAARTNVSNKLVGPPDVMFIVTDGSPNQTAANVSLTLTDPMTWVNAANEAILQANGARADGHWVRVVKAGPPDVNIPFPGTGADLFADAVLLRLAAGSAVETSFDGIATGLLESAGCNPNIVKSAGALVDSPVGGLVEYVDWVVTVVNTSATPMTNVSITDLSANNFRSVQFVGTGGSCSPNTQGAVGPWVCTVPAKSAGVNGEAKLTLRTTLAAYDVCQGTSGANTATANGGGLTNATSNEATYNIAPLSASDPSCLSDITVHKIEEGSFATASNTWNMRLNNGTTNTDQNITDGGTTVFTPLPNGTYSVTEMNAGAVATCSPTVAAGSYTVAWSDTQAGTYTPGGVRSGIVINGTGQHRDVWFKNTPCPSVVSIAKTHSPAGDIPAGSSFTWNIIVNVAVNPTTAAITVADTVPAGFTINTVTETAFGSCAFSGASLTNCVLPAGTAPGTYTIAIAATAPADFPRANCAAYTNTATLSGTAGMTLVVAPGETAAAGTATDPVTVINCRDPKLALSKSHLNLPSPLPGGGTFTWQVKAVVSDGPTVAAATITDTLPVGFAAGAASFTGSQDASKLSCSLATGQVNCTLAANAASGDYFINIPVTAPGALTTSICTTYTNQATAAFPPTQGTVTGSPATDSVTITCPDVSIAKSRTSAATVTPGTNNVTYSIVVSNAGPGAAVNINVNDTLQAGVTWTASSAGAACVAGNTPMCVIASIPAGQSVTITVTGTTTSPASCGVINNTATIVGANDATPGNNTDPGEPVTVECPDASVVKTLTSPVSIDSGDTITYTIVVSAGPNGASQNLVVTDVLEEAMSWTVSGPNVGDCNGPTFPSGGATLNCTIPTLAPNTSHTYTLTAVTSAAVCGPVDNNAVVSSTFDVNSNNNSSTAADVTVKCPNVVLQKTTSTPGPLNAGDPISYTITATNNGTGVAKDFFLVDNLPTNVTGWQINPANPACAITGTQLRCPGTSPNTTTLAGGASLSVTVTGTTTPNSCGTVANTAHAEASNDGASGITDAAAPAINVLCPDVTVLKDGNGPVNAGDQVIFTITVDNIGQGTAKTVALNDTLLAGQKWTLGGADAAACILTAQNAPQSLSCSWPTLTGAETAKVITLSHPTGTGSGLACTPVQNTAGVTAANEDSAAASNLNSSTDSVSINCAEIKIVKVADASPVSGTDNIGFMIKVWNTGAAPALGVQVTDTLPSNPGLNWAVDSAACSITSGVLTCNLGTLAANQTEATATIIHLTSPTTVATCGTVSNPVAQVTTTNDGSATDGENIVVNCPDVTVSKALYETPNPVSAGDTIKFKIVVTVSGAPGTVAKNVTVNEQLPATTSGWTVESTTPGGICAALVSTLLCTLGDVTIPAGGAPVTFEIIITGDAIGASGEVTCSGNITNTVTVAAGNESNTNNNEATAPVAVNCPSVELTKSANSDSVVAGDPLSFTLTVKNTGGGTAHSVVVEDDLPAGLTWSESDGACSIVAGKLVCNFAELLPGEANWKSVVVTATTSFAACSSLSNTAFISAGNDNLSGSQQTPSNEVNVDLLCSDVTITKAPESGDEVLDLGETATFIITVNTATGGDAHDVEVTDTLPLKPGLIWSESEADCSVTAAAEGVAQVLTCTFDVIPDGGSETIEVTSNAMTMDTCGEITNIASVVAGNEDPTKSGDNTSNEATIFVNCPDLEVLKSGEDINNGEAPVFTVTVKNKGVGVAKDVSVIEQLPPGTWTTTLAAPVPVGCSITIPGPGCTTLAPNETLTITITGEVTTTQCDPIENTASVSASNESDDVTIQANNSSTATVNIACGTIQIVKIDHVLPGNPNLSDAWHFTVDKGGQPFDTAEIALGGGSVSITKVPFGTYTVAEDEDQDIDTCPVPNPVSATFSTVVDDDTQELSAITPDATFTFTNEECGVVGSTGFLEIHKVSDINGNHVMDSGDTTLSGWPMTITGPEFPGGVVINTDSQGRILLPGIETGSYTVTEGSRTGYTTVGVVADDNAPVFSVANTATVDLAYSDTDIVTFYNQPHGSIVVRKHAVSVHNGIETDSPADLDGWVMTVSSATCGVNQQAATNASGIATFNNLPMCSDYVVSENPVNGGSPNFNVVGSPSQSPFTPGLAVATEVTFTNERVTTDPPCPNCAQQPTPTPTQVPPTATTPATATATNTTVPTNTVGPSTPTAVSTTAGERTPGPAQPTPVAPSTGEGIFGDTVGGTNLLLVLAGLAALAGGLAVVALGRGRRSGGR